MSETPTLPDRGISPEMQLQIIEMDLQGFSKWDAKKLEDYAEAEKIFSQQLQLIQLNEKIENRAIDKGGTLYKLGLSLAFQGKMKEAILRFLQAYTEDTLNNELGKEDEADRGAAFNVLRNYFRVQMNVICEINKQSNLVKSSGQWKEAKNPNDILDKVSNSLGIKISDPNQWVKLIPDLLLNVSPFGFPQPWEHRVFIGGCYRDKESIRILNNIKDAVRRVDLNYIPIIGFDAYIEKKKQIHHHTLLLLHTCKWAIFEVTNPAGQLMEIERALDYENKILILYRKEKGKTPKTVSSMTITIPKNRAKFKGYKNEDEIYQIVKKFLPPFKDAGK